MGLVGGWVIAIYSEAAGLEDILAAGLIPKFSALCFSERGASELAAQPVFLTGCEVQGFECLRPFRAPHKRRVSFALREAPLTHPSEQQY